MEPGTTTTIRSATVGFMHMAGQVEHIAVDPQLWVTLAGADMAE